METLNRIRDLVQQITGETIVLGEAPSSFFPKILRALESKVEISRHEQEA